MITLIHIGIYLAPIQLVTELSASEMPKRDDKSVPIPNHRKLIGPVFDSRVRDQILDAFLKGLSVEFNYTVTSYQC